MVDENLSIVTEMPVQPWETFALRRLDELLPEFDPKNFQHFSVYRAICERIFVVGLQTGLGKTLVSLLSYFYYRIKFPDTKLLVFTSNSAVLQFRNELDKFFAHELDACSIHKKMKKFSDVTYDKKKGGYAQTRQFAYQKFGDHQGGLDALFLNYAVLRRDAKLIHSAVMKLQRKGIAVFSVFDEATNFYTLDTQTHYATYGIASNSERVLGLTATITKGKLEQIYGIYKALGFLVAPTKSIFEDRYCVYSYSFIGTRKIRKIDGYINTEEFVNIIKPVSIVLRKKDVAKYLPKFTPQKIMLEHSPDQFNLIGRLMAGMVVQGDDEVPHTVTKLTEVGYVKRALQDVRLVTKQNLHDFSLKAASPKTKYIIDRLQNEFCDEKIVIYSPSKVYVNLLRDTIHSLAVKGQMDAAYSRVLTITGDVSPDVREDYKKLFSESSDYNLMIINNAGADAINLQAASVMIIATLPKSGGDLVQLVGRISRIGSQHTNLLLYYLLTEDSQDLDEYLAMHRQMQIMSQVIGEAEEGLIDFEALKEMERASDLSDEDYKRKSLLQILFHTRKTRENYYYDPARMLKLGEA
jgi:superfamily II DNA or RNA helicase